jgi:hypothetical protein
MEISRGPVAQGPYKFGWATRNKNQFAKYTGGYIPPAQKHQNPQEVTGKNREKPGSVARQTKILVAPTRHTTPSKHQILRDGN